MARREVSASEFRRMTYEKQQKYLQQFIDDIDEEVDKNIENQESDEDYVSQSKPDGDEASDVEDVFTDINNKIEIDTDGDDSSDEDFDDFQESSSQSDVLVAKDKTIWQRKPFTASRTLKRNLLREKTGPVRSTKTLSIKDTLKCVFIDVITLTGKNIFSSKDYIWACVTRKYKNILNSESEVRFKYTKQSSFLQGNSMTGTDVSDLNLETASSTNMQRLQRIQSKVLCDICNAT
ncbi:uncharacterized protein [Diabrotica undecimpunctata]|uniref:uncharacterized protein n=1 Tax=Diabrotica undecimpunctata TaxID=50387 RepID=UPI003B633052